MTRLRSGALRLAGATVQRSCAAAGLRAAALAAIVCTDSVSVVAKLVHVLLEYTHTCTVRCGIYGVIACELPCCLGTLPALARVEICSVPPPTDRAATISSDPITTHCTAWAMAWAVWGASGRGSYWWAIPC